MSDLGRYLYKLRKSKGGKGFWGLRAVADRIPISHPYLSNLETGKATRPSPEILRKIADVFNIPVSELLIKSGYLDDDNKYNPSISVPIRYTTAEKNAILSEIPQENRGAILVDRNITTTENCFAVTVNCSCFTDIGVHCGDVLIVDVSATIKNGDMVVVQYGEMTMIRKMFLKQHNVILSSIQCNDEPIIAHKKEVGVLGKVTKAIKTF